LPPHIIYAESKERPQSCSNSGTSGIGWMAISSIFLHLMKNFGAALF
jgi:hypothetical protein